MKNLLYHSYGNECSIEDYSIELGIARPYIEEIVNRLVEVTLLKKEGNKYITNFAFIDKAVLNKILDSLSSSFIALDKVGCEICKYAAAAETV